MAQDSAVLLNPLRILAESGDDTVAPGFVPFGVPEAVDAVFETIFRRHGGITVYRSPDGGSGAAAGAPEGGPDPAGAADPASGGPVLRSGGFGSMDAELLAALNDPQRYLQADRVELIALRRQTGLDGLVTGSVAPSGEGVAVTVHCLNFSAGEIFYADTITGVFGADLIAQVEQVAEGFARSITEFDATTLTVSSIPPGATVLLNDAAIGVTPLKGYRTEPGEYTLRLQAAGHLPGEARVALTDGEKAQVHVSLYEEEAAALVERVNAFSGEFHSLTIGSDVAFQPYGPQPDFFFPAFTALYTGKWRAVGGGLGLSAASYLLERSLDTAVGEGSETITLDSLQFFLTGRYYPVSVRRRLDVFAAASGGLSFLNGYSPGNPRDYEQTNVIAPYGRAEAGVGFVLLNFLRLEVYGGYHYQGRAEIYRKQPYIWGEASFTEERFHLHPFFVGVRTGAAVYPASLRARL